MSSPHRRYDDACATAHALELIGERWALLVMREMMLGPRRFSDLRASLSGISANVLTQRLEGLEAVGVVRRRKLPPPASVHVYELTPWGLEAEPIILALGKWGARSPRDDATMPFSPVSLMLSFRAMFEPTRATGVNSVLHFRFGAENFEVAIKRGALIVKPGAPAQADVTIESTPETVAALIYDNASAKALERSGALKITGTRAALTRFASVFEMPAKVGG